MNDLDRKTLLRQGGLYGMEDIFRRTGRYSDAQHFTVMGFASHQSEHESRQTCSVRNRADGEAEETLL
jgi:hypothetical protein